MNLIGEHTDYNDGFVLPTATRQATWIAAGKAQRGSGADASVRVYSAGLDEEYAWPIGAWGAQKLPRWTGYVAGVLALLQERGIAVPSFDALIHSEVPVGGGLSSSAALTVSTARAATALAGVALSIAELAALCRGAENQYAGVPCGVMDPYAVLATQEGAAILLDCRTLEYEQVPLPLGECAIVVVDSGVRHELASSEYARRQAQCAEALEVLRGARPEATALRDFSPEDVEAHTAQMSAIAAKRARHVTSENQRTLAAVAALRAGDLAEMGRLMSASHRSLRDDYEVSCPELDMLVEIVGGMAGVLGARMTGGGFGGCIVALAPRSLADDIAARVSREYDTPRRKSALVVIEPGVGADVQDC